MLQSLSVCVSACLLRPHFSPGPSDNICHQSNYLLPLPLLYPPPLQDQKRQCLLMLAAVVKGLYIVDRLCRTEILECLWTVFVFTLQIYSSFKFRTNLWPRCNLHQVFTVLSMWSYHANSGMSSLNLHDHLVSGPVCNLSTLVWNQLAFCSHCWHIFSLQLEVYGFPLCLADLTLVWPQLETDHLEL